MKIPGPDHPITITRNPRHVQALFHGHLIADSAASITLKEAGLKPVIYFPRDDVAMDFLHRTDRRTYCPYKGDASYFTIARDGEIIEDGVWSYEDPYPAMEAIRGMVAFYPNEIEIHEVAADETRPGVGDVVQHTDSGAGRSQGEHWQPNVQAPLG